MQLGLILRLNIRDEKQFSMEPFVRISTSKSFQNPRFDGLLKLILPVQASGADLPILVVSLNDLGR
jgi:hypothetical protein